MSENFSFYAKATDRQTTSLFTQMLPWGSSKAIPKEKERVNSPKRSGAEKAPVCLEGSRGKCWTPQKMRRIMDWNRKADALTLLRRVRNASSFKEKIAHFQSIRLGKFFPAEAGFFWVADTIMRLAEQWIDEQQKTTFKSVNRQLNALLRSYG
jgi:hypothetical protein